MQKGFLGLLSLLLVAGIWSIGNFTPTLQPVKRAPSSAGRNIGDWFQDRFALFQNRIQFEASCVSGCQAKRKGKVLEGSVKENQEMVIEIKTKNAYSGFEVRPLKPELIELKLLEQKDDKTFKYSVAFKKGKFPRSPSGRLVRAREELILVRPITSKSGHDLIAQRDIKLRFNLEQLNTPPVFDLPASIELTGAVSTATIPMKVSDAEGDTVFVECAGLGRINGQITIGQSIVCTARDGYQGGYGVLSVNHRIEVTRQNTAPDIEHTGRIAVPKNQLTYPLSLSDKENDPVTATCYMVRDGQFSSMNLCHGNLINLQELPLGEEVTIRVSASDRHLSQTKDILFVRVERKEIRYNFSLPTGFSYSGSIIENFSELGIDASHILQNNLPGYEEGQFQIGSDIQGEFELLAKKDLEEFSIKVIIERKNVNQLEKIEKELAQDGVRGSQSIELSLPGMGTVCANPNCFNLLSTDLSALDSEDLAPLKNLDYLEGKLQGEVEWTKVESALQQSFVIVASNGHQVKSFLLQLQYHFEGPQFSFKGESKFDIGQSAGLEFEVGLGTVPSAAHQVDLSSLEADFVIFNTNYDRSTKKLTLNSGENKLFLLARGSAGEKRKIVRLFTRQGDSYPAIVTYEIKKSEEVYIKLRLYNLVNSLGDASYSPERLVESMNETYRMFKGRYGIQVLEYNVFRKPDHSASFYDGNDDDEEFLEELVDRDRSSIAVLLSQKLVANDGTEVGGLGPLPSYASQRHYALVSRNGDEGTITHELGHNFGLEHTFKSENNPVVGLCSEVQGSDGLKYCRYKGQQGNLILPQEIDPSRNASLVGDGVSDTPVDADKTTFFAGNCYGSRFNDAGVTRQYHCPADGVALANVESEEVPYSVISIAGEDTCKFQWSDRTVKCKGAYPADPSKPDVKTNIMSYWPHSENTKFSTGQHDRMKEKFEQRNLKIKDFLSE